MQAQDDSTLHAINAIRAWLKDDIRLCFRLSKEQQGLASVKVLVKLACVCKCAKDIVLIGIWFDDRLVLSLDIWFYFRFILIKHLINSLFT